MSKNSTNRIQEQMNKEHKRTFVLLVILVLLVEIWILNVLYHNELESEIKEAKVYGESVASSFKISMGMYINKSEFLESMYLEYGDTFLNDFENMCNGMVGSDDVIQGIYIAPDGIIEYAYPYEKNGSNIGYEIFNVPFKTGKIKIEKSEDSIILAGPYINDKSEKVFGINHPIHKSDTGVDYSVIILDWDKFTSNVINSIDDKGKVYNFAVWKDDNNVETDEYQYVLNNSTHNVSKKTYTTIKINNDVWYLAVEPKGGFNPVKGIRIEIVISVALFIILLAFVYFRIKSSEKIMYSVEYDELTGLYNKHAFYSYAKKTLEANNNTDYDIVILDVENFKLVNSIYGEKKGDEVLKFIADEVDRNTKNGLCARFGGDQFICMVPYDENREWLSIIIEDVMSSAPVEKLVIKYGIYQKIDKTLSIVAICDRALLALKSIKHNYEKSHASYDGPISKKQLQIQEFETEFSKALENEEFVVWYQPKFSAESEKLVGAEALVRWIKKDGTIISPGEFIPVFEDDGLIAQLDEYVFGKVCENIKEWHDKGMKLLPISINLSRASLRNEGIVEKYKKIADEIGVPTECVPIELTESASLHSVHIKEFTIELKSAGFALYMDDFGSGFSSLASLNTLPFDVIKLDKSLIDLLGDEGGDEIIRHIIEIAHFKNMQVVAEGVERKEQLDTLRDMKCDVIQGFYFSPPKPCEKFVEYLNEHSN